MKKKFIRFLHSMGLGKSFDINKWAIEQYGAKLVDNHIMYKSRGQIEDERNEKTIEDARRDAQEELNRRAALMLCTTSPCGNYVSVMDQIKALTWQPKPCAGPVDFPTMQAEITKGLSVQVANQEEHVLIEVLGKHLGRLITTADFKDCQMKYMVGRSNEYLFAYKGVDLGWVKKELKMGALDVADFRHNQYNMQYVIYFTPVKAK